MAAIIKKAKLNSDAVERKLFLDGLGLAAPSGS
jgi:hypothetical protein